MTLRELNKLLKGKEDYELEFAGFEYPNPKMLMPIPKTYNVERVLDYDYYTKKVTLSGLKVGQSKETQGV